MEVSYLHDRCAFQLSYAANYQLWTRADGGEPHAQMHAEALVFHTCLACESHGRIP